MKEKQTDLWNLLRYKFPEKEYALLQEVRDAAGYFASRSADAIAMNLWPSRGLVIHGIEIKKSRQDWRKELKNPEKAESIARYCDLWWIVDATGDAVKESEVPLAWGFMQVKGSSLRTIREAKLEMSKKPISRHFLAALLKRATKGSIPLECIEGEIKRNVQIANSEKDSEHEARVRNLVDDVARYKKVIEEFEEKSGIKMRAYESGEIGEVVKLLVKGGASHVLEQLSRCAESMGKVNGEINNSITELQRLQK